MQITSLNTDVENNRIWFSGNSYQNENNNGDNRKRNGDSGVNSSESNISNNSVEQQARMMNSSSQNLSVEKNVIYSNELCSFVSMDVNDRGRVVAASDNGVLVYV